MKPAAGAALAASLLAACSWLPAPVQVPPTAVQALPAQWEAPLPASGPALAGWWRQFGDPLLADLVAQSLKANPSLEAARASLRQARALRDVAAAALATTVQLSASGGGSKTGDSTLSHSYNISIDASWEPDWFGTRRFALQAAEGEAQAAAVNLADAQVSLAAEVAQAYVTLRLSQARLAIARDSLASQNETEQITAWRVTAGLLTSLEGEQARAARAQAAARVPSLEVAVAQSMHAVAVLCGQAPAAMQAQLAPVRPVPDGPAGLAVSLPAQTLAQRPDVRAAEFQLQAARARYRQADAARLPNLRLQGSIGLHGLGIGGVSTTWLSQLLGSVVGTAFDAGSARSQVNAQESAWRVAEANYRTSILSALRDVEDSLQSLAGDQQRLGQLREAHAAAANAALLARQRYASGLTDFQTVLETQRSLYGNQDDEAATRAAVTTDLIHLYKALGGGWTPDSPDLAKLP